MPYDPPGMLFPHAYGTVPRRPSWPPSPTARARTGGSPLRDRARSAPSDRTVHPHPRDGLSAACGRRGPSVRPDPPLRGRAATMQVDELLKPFPIKEFHPFPRALLGPGSHELIGPEALKLGFKKTLVMTSGLRGSDIVHKIAESMKYHGLEVVVYDKVESNPKDYNVMDAVAMYQQNGCDSFVSIGGGSSHDACKGARVSVAHDGRNVNEFEGFNKCENPKNPPHIAVSTTAGTGSETSWAYVITDTTTDPDNPHKYVAFDDASVTTLAIDDPVLYYSCPIDYTAQCGFDVLAHASRALRLPAELPAVAGQRAARDQADQREPARGRLEPQDVLAGREGMMYAQYIAAQAFNSGGLGIIHSISHAVSAFYDTHHGLNNAVALPARVGVQHAGRLPALRRHRRGDGHRHPRHDRRCRPPRPRSAAAIRLLRDVGIPERFVDVKQDSYSKNRLGVGPTKFYENASVITGDDADVDRITNHVLGDACTPGNAKECTFETVRPVVDHCMNGDLDDLLTADRLPGGADAPRSAPPPAPTRSSLIRARAPFASVDEVVDALGAQGYIADTRLATTVFLRHAAGEAAAARGAGRRRQDRAGQGAGRGHRPPAAAPAVLRGPGRDQGPLRVGLRQAAALHPDPAGEDRPGRRGRPGPRVGRRPHRRPGERVLLRAVPRAAPAAGGDPLRGAGGAADRRGRPRRRGARGRAAGDAGRVPGVGAGGGHVRRQAAAVRDADQQQHPRPVGRAQAPLPAPVPRLPDGRARAGDRPVARTPGCRTRWPRSSWRSCAGCASWSCASRRRSRRRSTGRARWRCSASRS